MGINGSYLGNNVFLVAKMAKVVSALMRWLQGQQVNSLQDNIGTSLMSLSLYIVFLVIFYFMSIMILTVCDYVSSEGVTGE